MAGNMTDQFIVSRDLLNRLATCREDDILPRLMEAMRKRVPVGVTGFYCEQDGKPVLIPFCDIYPDDSLKEFLE